MGRGPAHLFLAAVVLSVGCGRLTPPGCEDGAPDRGLACAAAAVPSCSRKLSARPKAPDPPRKDSGKYTTPGPDVVQALRTSVIAAFGGDGPEARRQGRAAGYEVCQDGGGHLRWTPSSGSGGAAWLIDPEPTARPMILEAPHSDFDRWTRDVAADLRERIDARVVLVSGAHRCSAQATNACSGQNRTCGDRTGPHRISDPVHDVDGTFHAAHEALTRAVPEAAVVSLHGMPGDGASVSNGTTDDVAKDAPVARLGRALRERFPAEQITACNRHEGATYANRMCGTRNAQGRHVNGSPEPCTEPATAASGRFVHLELSKALRKQPAGVAEALQALLP